MAKHVIKQSPLNTRGYVAKLLAINPETLRFYEAQKLIKKPSRLANNYRIYDEDDLQRLRFILMAKKLGFTLKDIKELLSLSLANNSNRKKVRTISENKSKLIKEKISQLKQLKNTLDKL